MLLPCLLALLIRINVLRRTEDNRAATSGIPVRQLALTTLEGILWAAGFWLKPFVAIPAVAVLIGSLRFSLTGRA